jgi:hypothetical protein
MITDMTQSLPSGFLHDMAMIIVPPGKLVARYNMMAIAAVPMPAAASLTSFDTILPMVEVSDVKARPVNDSR